ncbi:hypothetical protein ACWD6R_16490 [Streptomyces sp. NPDC005151]
MPDHARVNRPEWQALWQQYEAVTTPLRAAGLACDIETSGGETVIYANLPDGTHLVIADDHSLPDRLADVTGWRIVRSHVDNPNHDGLLYDSTAEGEHGQHAADIRTMLAAVAIYLHDLRDPDTKTAGQVLGMSLIETPERFAVSFVGVSTGHTPTGQITSGPFDTHLQAVKEYGWQTHQLEQDGWQMVHEQGGTEWPLTIWHRREEAAQIVFVARVAN